MSSRTKALFAILIASILWGTAGVAAKVLLTELNPFIINFYRYFLASLVILPFFLKHRKHTIPWRILIPISLLPAINVNLFYFGLQTTTANSAYLIGASTTIVTAVLASILIHEHISYQKSIGILIGLLGTIVVITLPILNHGQMLSMGSVFGNIILSTGLFFWVLYTIITRRFMSHGSMSALDFPAVNFFTTTFVSLFFALITKQSFFTAGSLHPAYLFTLGYTAIGVTVCTYVLLNWALQYISVATASYKEYMQLFFGMMFNAIFLGETMTLGLWIGGILIVIGLLITSGSRMIVSVRKKNGGKTTI